MRPVVVSAMAVLSRIEKVTNKQASLKRSLISSKEMWAAFSEAEYEGNYEQALSKIHDFNQQKRAEESVDVALEHSNTENTGEDNSVPVPPRTAAPAHVYSSVPMKDSLEISFSNLHALRTHWTHKLKMSIANAQSALKALETKTVEATTSTDITNAGRVIDIVTNLSQEDIEVHGMAKKDEFVVQLEVFMRAWLTLDSNLKTCRDICDCHPGLLGAGSFINGEGFSKVENEIIKHANIACKFLLELSSQAQKAAATFENAVQSWRSVGSNKANNIIENDTVPHVLEFREVCKALVVGLGAGLAIFSTPLNLDTWTGYDWLTSSKPVSDDDETFSASAVKIQHEILTGIHAVLYARQTTNGLWTPHIQESVAGRVKNQLDRIKAIAQQRRVYLDSLVVKDLKSGIFSTKPTDTLSTEGKDATNSLKECISASSKFISRTLETHQLQSDEQQGHVIIDLATDSSICSFSLRASQFSRLRTTCRLATNEDPTLNNKQIHPAVVQNTIHRIALANALRKSILAEYVNRLRSEFCI